MSNSTTTLNKLRRKQTLEAKHERRALRRMEQMGFPGSPAYERALKRLRNTLKRTEYIETALAQAARAEKGAIAIAKKQDKRDRLRKMTPKDRATAKGRGDMQFANGTKQSDAHFKRCAPRRLRDA